MISQACLYDQALIKTASLVAYLVKNLPAMQETWVLFLTLEDPLEKEMATHSIYGILHLHGESHR